MAGGLIKIYVLLTVTMFALGGVVIGIARLTSRDLFSAYLAVMPGQSIDGLKGVPCRFITSKTTNTQWGECLSASDLGLFGPIELIAYGHIIKQVNLTVQGDRLHFGDLALCWGEPSLVTYGTNALHPVAWWGSEVSTDVTLENAAVGVSDFLAIQYLFIRDAWLPCRSA